MEKFLIRKPQDSSSTQEKQSDYNSRPNSSKRICVDLNNLPSDPGLREKISSYHPNDQDNIRRAYIQKGPYQLVPHNLPQTEIVDQCVGLILIGFLNTKIGWNTA